MRKLAVIFPGIGYGHDRSLLYFSKKLAENAGYDVIQMVFEGLPKDLKSHPEQMAPAFSRAFDQTDRTLEEIPFEYYDDIVFISKSFGTAVAAAYSMQYNLPARHIFFTPLLQTFIPVPTGFPAMVFHGTADTWAAFPDVFSACQEKGIPLYGIENANHSLETASVSEDIGHLSQIMPLVDQFLIK